MPAQLATAGRGSRLTQSTRVEDSPLGTATPNRISHTSEAAAAAVLPRRSHSLAALGDTMQEPAVETCWSLCRSALTTYDAMGRPVVEDGAGRLHAGGRHRDSWQQPVTVRVACTLPRARCISMLSHACSHCPSPRVPGQVRRPNNVQGNLLLPSFALSLPRALSLSRC